MNNQASYVLARENGRIALKAASYRAEKGSVLHSGIFSRELSSSFVGAVGAVAILAVFAIIGELRIIHYLIAVAVFTLVFPLARVFVFKEPYLETIFDRSSQEITIRLSKPLRTKSISRPLRALRDIRMRHVKFEPENPDGVAFVEKIALQHGTVIPGFGETVDFYTVDLQFEEETHTILSTKSLSEAQKVMDVLKRYLAVIDETE